MANIWLQFEAVGDAARRCRTCGRILRRADDITAWEHVQQTHRHLYVKLRGEADEATNGDDVNINENHGCSQNSNATTPKTESSDGGADSNERRKQVNAELIELVRDHPCLYDKRNEHYKDTAYKARVWEELAMRLEMENGKQATLRWKNLGDTYARNRKRQANGANITWPHFTSMTWLEQFRERAENGLPTTVDLHRSYDEVLQKFFNAMDGGSGNSPTTVVLNELDGLNDATNADAVKENTKGALAMNIADLAGLAATGASGIFGGLGAFGFGTGFGDIFGNGLLSLAPSVSGACDGISAADTAVLPKYSSPDLTKSTTNNKIKATKAAMTDGCKIAKTTKITTTSRARSTTKSNIGVIRERTTVDEPRWKKARRTIDGALYQISDCNETADDNNGNENTTDDMVDKCAGRYDNKHHNNTNDDNMFNEKVNSEYLKEYGETSLFGALIARKLEELDGVSRLAAQTEILALLNAKLLDHRAMNEK